MMTRRNSWLALSAAVLAFGCAVIGAAACSSEPDVHYGNPTTLNKDNLPGEAGLEPLACGGEGGATTSADGGCAVSWSGDLYARMIGNNGWQCATSACHAPGHQAPAIDPGDASAAYASLKAYKMSTKPGVSYIDTSGDPSKSSIECNLGGGCNPVMPIGNGTPLSETERCKLHVWLQCGAPNN
jgi:hypothetical protein